jgi:hypothetical protein
MDGVVGAGVSTSVTGIGWRRIGALPDTTRPFAVDHICRFDKLRNCFHHNGCCLTGSKRNRRYLS